MSLKANIRDRITFRTKLWAWFTDEIQSKHTGSNTDHFLREYGQLSERRGKFYDYQKASEFSENLSDEKLGTHLKSFAPISTKVFIPFLYELLLLGKQF